MLVESRSGGDSNVAGAGKGHTSSNGGKGSGGNEKTPVAYLYEMKLLLLLYAGIVAMLSMTLEEGRTWEKYVMESRTVRCGRL